MKKAFSILVAVALCVAATLSLTACGDDDDEPAAGSAYLTISIKTQHITGSTTSGSSEYADFKSYINSVQSALYSAVGADSNGHVMLTTANYSSKSKELASKFQNATMPDAPEFTQIKYTIVYELEGYKNLSASATTLAERTFTNE